MTVGLRQCAGIVMSDFDPASDGITHINIYSKSRTALGRGLSNWADWPIEIPPYGTFRTVEGFWFWLPTGDDYLRSCTGYEAKVYGKEIEKTEGKRAVEGFEDKLRFALKCKIDQCLPLKRALSQSSLPLAHYYVYGGKVVPAGHEWLVEEWESIRLSLK